MCFQLPPLLLVNQGCPEAKSKRSAACPWSRLLPAVSSRAPAAPLLTTPWREHKGHTEATMKSEDRVISRARVLIGVEFVEDLRGQLKKAGR